MHFVIDWKRGSHTIIDMYISLRLNEIMKMTMRHLSYCIIGGAGCRMRELNRPARIAMVLIIICRQLYVADMGAQWFKVWRRG